MGGPRLHMRTSHQWLGNRDLDLLIDSVAEASAKPKLRTSDATPLNRFGLREADAGKAMLMHVKSVPILSIGRITERHKDRTAHFTDSHAALPNEDGHEMRLTKQNRHWVPTWSHGDAHTQIFTPCFCGNVCQNVSSSLFSRQRVSVPQHTWRARDNKIHTAWKPHCVFWQRCCNALSASWCWKRCHKNTAHCCMS